MNRSSRGRVVRFFAFVLFMLTVQNLAAQENESKYREAYDSWCKQANGNWIPLWFRTDGEYPPLREAYVRLFQIGPNMIPFLVEELRKEQDPFRLYRLINLIEFMGVQVRLPVPGASTWDLAEESKRDFLQKWDTGWFLDLEQVLEAERKGSDEDKAVTVVESKRLKLRKYGVYALPFIARKLKKHNSAELFADYLGSTGQFDLYTEYLEKPQELFPTRQDKFRHLRDWVKTNEQRINKLHPLHENLKAAVEE